ncbi:MAG: UDP-N-acetylmuramoyl-L-alanyl-D-glutamate--2,6-diaminopimelate ligase [Deltaproteobacteria bacterium]|nr:UDP-N-acetylmuramoyl-L-alanyl-D-glutamate--2,6-diaminopimelate ligase [Deltaproteobacteria bacterium]
MTLADVAREIPGATTIEGDGSVRIYGVHHDSRRIEPGDLFVVRKGERSDGAKFVEAAKEKGAVAILAPFGVDVGSDRPVLRVDEVMAGLAYAAAAVYGHPAFSLDVVGITGTNGKTTTTHLVRTAIDAAIAGPAPSCGIVGTIGHSYAGRTIPASHTTPEADELARVLAIMKKRGATHVAMEVSSIALVLGRVKAVRFRVAAFTNLTQDHLDFHGTMEAYADAKKMLFTTCEPGLAVVNVDDPFGQELARVAKCKVLRVRTKVEGAQRADVFPLEIALSGGGMRITADVAGKRVELDTRLVGMHNVENLLVALGIVSALELDVHRAAKALAAEPGAPGRLERCDGEGDDVVVLVDYAHTPDALARVLDAVRGVAPSGSRVLCVFGCGGDRDPTKRAPMGEAAGARADLVIVTSDNPRTEMPEAIAEPVEAGVRGTGLSRLAKQELPHAKKGYVIELDRRKAITHAIRAARPGDIVVIAGKGHEDYQIIGTEKRPFDDRVEARRVLEERREGAPPPPESTRGSLGAVPALAPRSGEG